jgi:predicted phosphohydrolase
MFSFDLISDLHIETWSNFDWSYRATSPVCVIAGDVARDHSILKNTLNHLSSQYQAVMFLDGNDEHRLHLNDLDLSYSKIKRITNSIKKVTYLQNNCIIANEVAILGTNGWWGFDFLTPESDPDSIDWFCKKYNVEFEKAIDIARRAKHDTMYLYNSIQRLQAMKDVKKIVLVTHTVPLYELVAHDIDLEQNLHRLNTIGNGSMQIVQSADEKNKISTWCFGHYHKPVDTTVNGIRYVSNCRGRGNTAYCQSVYHPLKIQVPL